MNLTHRRLSPLILSHAPPPAHPAPEANSGHRTNRNQWDFIGCGTKPSSITAIRDPWLREETAIQAMTTKLPPAICH